MLSLKNRGSDQPLETGRGQQPRYAEAWKRDGDLDTFKRKILYGVTDEDLWRHYASEDLENIFKDDFRISPDDVILEFGCGIGRLIKAIVEKFNFRKLVGLDVNPRMVEYAQKQIQDSRVSFTAYDGGVTLPFESNTFDKIYSVLTFQHVDKHFAYFIFQDMLSVLKPHGQAVLQIQNWGGGRKEIIESCLFAAEDIVAGMKEPYIELYTEEELRHIFNDWLHVDDLKIKDWIYKETPPTYYRVFFRKPLDWPNRRFCYFKAFLDFPVDHEVVGQSLTVAGWAFSTAGIERTIVEIDGKALKPLNCDFDRPDVHQDYPTIESSLRSGFKAVLDVSDLSEGEHKLRVTARDQFRNEKVFFRTIQIQRR